MKNKKKVLIALVAVMFIGTFSVGSLANWFTSSDSVTNEFEMAKYEVVTNEEFNPKNINEDGSIVKKVSVKNTGTLPAYVRVKIVPYWKNGLPLKIGTSNTVTLNTVNLKESKEALADINNKCWFKVGDYYYYNNIVRPGETTKLLLESVKITIDDNMKNLIDTDQNYSNKNLTVDVFTESVYCKFDTKKEEGYKEAYSEDNKKNLEKYFNLNTDNEFKEIEESYLNSMRKSAETYKAEGGKTNGN